jgi:hypothetical protein
VSYGLLTTPNGSIPWTNVRSAGLDFSDGAVTTGALTASTTVISGGITLTGNLSLTGTISGSGLQFLTSTAISNTSFVAYNSSVINGLYDEYEFHFDLFKPVSSLPNACIRLSSSNGASWASTGVYNHTGSGTRNNAVFAQQVQTSSEVIISVSTGVRNDADFGGLSGKLRLLLPSDSTSVFKRVHFDTGGFTDTNMYHISGIGMLNGATYSGAINAIQFLYSSGNISTGTISVYGIRH